MTEEKHDRHTIREVRTYVDQSGREVDEFVQVFGKVKDPNVYKGRATMRVRVQNPRTGEVKSQDQTFDFDIPEATGVKNAFERFDTDANTYMDEMREAAKAALAESKSKIIAATSMPTIMGPNGTPMKG